MIGAIIAFTSRAILRARATGAVMSAPLLITPCGSSVPVGRMTVLIFEGTTSLNSIQLMSLISRVVTASGVWLAALLSAVISQIDKSARELRVILFPPCVRFPTGRFFVGPRLFVKCERLLFFRGISLGHLAWRSWTSPLSGVKFSKKEVLVMKRKA